MVECVDRQRFHELAILPSFLGADMPTLNNLTFIFSSNLGVAVAEPSVRLQLSDVLWSTVCGKLLARVGLGAGGVFPLLVPKKTPRA